MSKRFFLAACVCTALFGSIELNAAKVQASTSLQQARPVTGVVSDKMGPVSGAYVTVKGSLMLTVSSPSRVSSLVTFSWFPMWDMPLRRFPTPVRPH